MSDEQSPVGTFCWNELMTRDIVAAKKFYSELIGWNPTDGGMPGMDYTLLKIGDKDAGGMMAMPDEVPKEVPSHWMSYIMVKDVDASAKKTTELGGTVIHGPQDIPTVGRYCVIQDPTGASVALFQSAN